MEEEPENAQESNSGNPAEKLLNLYLIGLTKGMSGKRSSSICIFIITIVLPSLKAECPYIPMPNKWILHEVNGSRPEARESGTLTKVPIVGENFVVEERIYLFGGMGRGLLSSLSYFQLTANGIFC